LVDGVDVHSTGTAPDAECPINADLVDWADELYVMEARQRKLLQQRFGSALVKKRVVCLDVPDRYGYMQPELIELLQNKMAPYLPSVPGD
jgi:predicted protein tyrosine phosphatase